MNIDPDLILVLGMVFALLSLPTLISAFSESRSPRLGAIMFVLGAAMVAWAINATPSAFSFEKLPDIFISVIGRYIG